MRAFNVKVVVAAQKLLADKLQRTLADGFIAHASKENRQAALGHEWLHEIKHDSFRVIARKGGAGEALQSPPE